MSHFSLDAFRILSLFLAFNTLTQMSLNVDILVFILLRVHQTSWMCWLVFFIKFGEFLAMSSSNIFSVFYSLFLSSGTSVICRHDGIPLFSEAFFIYIYSFWSLDCINLTSYLQVNLSSDISNILLSLSNEVFYYYIFQPQNLHLKNLFYWYHLMSHRHHTFKKFFNHGSFNFLEYIYNSYCEVYLLIPTPGAL